MEACARQASALVVPASIRQPFEAPLASPSEPKSYMFGRRTSRQVLLDCHWPAVARYSMQPYDPSFLLHGIFPLLPASSASCCHSYPWWQLQGSEGDAAGVNVEWGPVQDLVRVVQSKQTISKDTFAGIKKNLKSPSKSNVCKTLTTLDSIAANCNSAIRLQLADARWIEMLLSICYKNPTAAMPVCQLLSNWVCSYGHEQLGHAAKFAAQALKQKGYGIPPPAPLAYHMVSFLSSSCHCLSLAASRCKPHPCHHHFTVSCRQKLLSRAHQWSVSSAALTSQLLISCQLQNSQVRLLPQSCSSTDSPCFA